MEGLPEQSPTADVFYCIADVRRYKLLLHGEKPDEHDVIKAASQEHRGDVHRGTMAFDDHNTAIGDVVERSVLREIESDARVIRHTKILHLYGRLAGGSANP